jgi:guanosine-3',5'-bis(diphosphate) 3'-pyrophosphohydrolase
METQTLYQEAIKFATAKHLEKEQKVPGTDLPYVVHLSNVAMEIIIAAFNSDYFNLGFAIQVALKEQQMHDSLTRIKKMQSEVWAIKLADRITNLQPPPPHWENGKKINYQEEARKIFSELKNGNEFLARRLEAKIEEYGNYINS